MEEVNVRARIFVFKPFQSRIMCHAANILNSLCQGIAEIPLVYHLLESSQRRYVVSHLEPHHTEKKEWRLSYETIHSHINGERTPVRPNTKDHLSFQLAFFELVYHTNNSGPNTSGLPRTVPFYNTIWDLKKSVFTVRSFILGHMQYFLADPYRCCISLHRVPKIPFIGLRSA
jgi:hypothetical protein